MLTVRLGCVQQWAIDVGVVPAPDEHTYHADNVAAYAVSFRGQLHNWTPAPHHLKIMLLTACSNIMRSDWRNDLSKWFCQNTLHTISDALISKF